MGVLVLALVGCAGQAQPLAQGPATEASAQLPFVLPAVERGGRPEWMDSDNDLYPRAAFLSFRDHGDTAAQAASLAHGRIIQMLRPLPQADEIGTLTPSIRIAGLWYRDGRYHALAVFSRASAEHYLRARLDALDAATRSDVDRLQRGIDPLTRIGILQTMIQRQQLRAAYQKSLKVADSDGRGRESPWDTLKWSAEMEHLMSALTIQPRVGGQSAAAEPLLKMLQNGLQRAGIRTEAGAPTKLMEGELQISYQARENGWVDARGSLSLRLSDVGADARALGDKVWNLDVTVIDAATAERRILGQSRRLLENEMHDVLLEVAASLSRSEQ